MTLTEEQRGTVAFDLEKARAICEAATKADFIFQDEQPDGDEDGWDGGYYKTGEILIIRDKNDDAAALESIGQLDRQGDAEFFCQAITLFPDALAEIERLRAALAESEKIVEHKSKSATHWYDEHLRAQTDLTQSKRVIEQQVARIKELEDAHKRSGKKYAKIINELRSSVYANIPGLDVGKIGPDAKPRVWQITEERKAAIWHAVAVLKENDPDGEHLWDEEIAVLRAMLREAE